MSVISPTTSAFDLPHHHAPKADPALIADDERRFAAIAEPRAVDRRPVRPPRCRAQGAGRRAMGLTAETPWADIWLSADDRDRLAGPFAHIIVDEAGSTGPRWSCPGSSCQTGGWPRTVPEASQQDAQCRWDGVVSYVGPIQGPGVGDADDGDGGQGDQFDVGMRIDHAEA